MKYLDRSPAMPLPYYALCLNEREYLRETKRLKLADPPKWVTPGANATTHTLEREGKLLCLVCFEMDKKRASAEVYGLLIHEGVHIYQQWLESMGEQRPGSEIEAYTIQWISQQLIGEYDRRTRRGR